MQPICGDLVVIRGNSASISDKGLKIIDELSIDELPSWLWWNGSLDESPEIFEYFTDHGLRLIIDTALGSPQRCLKVLDQALPINTSLNSEELLNLLKENLSNKDFEDFRGQFFESSISTLNCLLYTSPSPRDDISSRMPSSA